MQRSGQIQAEYEKKSLYDLLERDFVGIIKCYTLRRLFLLFLAVMLKMTNVKQKQQCLWLRWTFHISTPKGAYALQQLRSSCSVAFFPNDICSEARGSSTRVRTAKMKQHWQERRPQYEVLQLHYLASALSVPGHSFNRFDGWCTLAFGTMGPSFLAS